MTHNSETSQLHVVPKHSTPNIIWARDCFDDMVADLRETQGCYFYVYEKAAQIDDIFAVPAIEMTAADLIAASQDTEDPRSRAGFFYQAINTSTRKDL